MTIDALITHLRTHSLRTDGPFRLRSGAWSDWYLDARQTTFSGEGALMVGRAVLEVLDPAAQAVGGMTMGADPIAVATAIAAAAAGRSLRAFSVRKEEKQHGLTGRLVGPVAPGDRVVALEDTATTGGALWEAVEVLAAAGAEVIQAVVLLDRSQGKLEEEASRRRIPFRAVLTPSQLGLK
jgi:orotate phosphoribosyltransferase